MENRERMEAMGKKILEQTRAELFLSMRFMQSALGSLDFKMDLSTRTIGTDAAYIRFNPLFLMQMFMERGECMNRLYMHMLMHCIFRHMFSAKEHEDEELWDICCDMAVESVLDSMDYPDLLRVSSDFRQEWYAKLEEELGVLTAEKLYHYFILKKRDPYLEEALHQEFKEDDHIFWQRLLPPEDDENPKGAAGNTADQEAEQKQPNEDAKTEQRQGPASLPDEMAALSDEWNDRAKRLEGELESRAKDAGDEVGNLVTVLAMSNHKRTDYKEFLSKLAIYREELKVDMDSFDYGFYMYGLSLYHNMPLLEENEYCEHKKIDSLVIAIDTSASCQGNLVQAFLNETASLLARQENFFHKVNIHLLECDNQVQRDILITDLKELEEYANHFEVHGGYGTDFRPVFAHVDKLIRKGELPQLRGLMYFTDGFGEFPVKATSYETAFVFWQQDEFDDSKVPDWAIKLYFSEG